MVDSLGDLHRARAGHPEWGAERICDVIGVLLRRRGLASLGGHLPDSFPQLRRARGRARWAQIGGKSSELAKREDLPKGERIGLQDG